ncbi:MAG: SigB/SigF/SigG family RNA polymerase sigma factor [Vulcanimicrobiaceae bacterium]
MTAAERDGTIRELYPLVRAIARRVARVASGADPGDLAGDGALGLIRAVDSFDPGRGTTLETYARRLILGAMLNGLRRLDPVSERVRRTLRRAEERRYALAQERGTLPAFNELERGDDRIRRARVAAFRQATLSLDAPLAGSRDPLVDWQQEPSACADDRAKRAALLEAVALLPERQRRIVALHYGSELSLHAIGTKMRVSPQRVSQLHVSALQRLRHTVPPA